MTTAIIDSTYERLNTQADAIRRYVSVPELCKLCVLYMNEQVDVFDDILCRTLRDRKFHQNHLKLGRVFSDLYYLNKRNKHEFIGQYFNLLDATIHLFPNPLPYVDNPPWFAFYYIHMRYDYITYCCAVNGCKRRRCAMNQDSICSCGDPIIAVHHVP